MNLLRVPVDKEGEFVFRENRFLAKVLIGNEKVLVHVHDPGRLEELLYPGNRILIKRNNGEKRKTAWDLIAAKYDNMWVFTNSAYHRKISEIILGNMLKGYTLRAEVKIGNSRIDFLAEKDEKIAIEVKGCTLAKDGVALFPDAPTSRGRRHVEELIKFVKGGHKAMLLILVFRPDSRCFLPNEERDEKFAEAFRNAIKMGVIIKPVLLEYNGEWIRYIGELPVCTL